MVPQNDDSYTPKREAEVKDEMSFKTPGIQHYNNVTSSIATTRVLAPFNINQPV
jgi:hypothetical protein